MTVTPPEIRRRAEPTYPRGPYAQPDPYAQPRSDYPPATRASRRASRRQPGLPGWAALVVLLVISIIGAIVDASTGPGIRGGFNVALVVGSTVAILLVRRRGMFPIVIAPPIVYALVSGVVLYARMGGAAKKRSIVIDAAANFLVYGFPAIAGATAATLIVAGIRMLIKR